MKHDFIFLLLAFCLMISSCVSLPKYNFCEVNVYRDGVNDKESERQILFLLENSFSFNSDKSECSVYIVERSIYKDCMPKKSITALVSSGEFISYESSSTIVSGLEQKKLVRKILRKINLKNVLMREKK